MLQPRDYQQAAHDAAVDWMKKNKAPAVIEAATGAGKSIIVAMIAKSLHQLSGNKRVLCLAPSKELTEQNVEKYQAINEQCSVYSASIGKSLRHQVIYATEGTFKNVAARLGHEFAGVIIDEAHRITPTIQKIISDMREGNSNLRVIGLSATPYRLDCGFIFAKDMNGAPISEAQAREPYFTQLLYTIGAKELIARGYLTPPKVGEINAPSYDVAGLEVGRNGQYTNASLDKAYTGWGRKTASIIADIVAQAQHRKGVIIFCATEKHAQEALASLPPDLSAIVTGKTEKKERESIIRRFKAQRIKYLVNVSVLTTGFDAPHIDVVAILRNTESISLFQQMIGRGLRLCEGKTDALLLDYAGNLEKHCLDGDLFRPEVRAPYQSEGSAFIECQCPSCAATNHFAARKNDAGLEVNQFGYFSDLDGNEIPDAASGKPMPAHHGRRCRNLLKIPGGEYVQCDYYWSCKMCPACDLDNDITARYCRGCKLELIDPAAKLVEVHTKMKKDPTQEQCDEVLNIETLETLSRAGNPVLRVTFTTPYRVFTVYLMPEGRTQAAVHQYEAFMQHQNPRTVRYIKDGDFWRVTGYNYQTDDERLKERQQAV